MIRVLGVLCGAAIATALLTWLVGVPQFTSERDAADAPLAVVTLRDSAIMAPGQPGPPEPEAAAESGGALEPEAAPAAPVEPEAVLTTASPDLPPLDTAAADEPGPQPMATAEALPDPQWFAFWTPFRSEIAANGFVGRLQSVTGLDYRVVKVKAGVYEVAFAYTEDAEIDSNLSTISAATGLDLPGTP